MPEFVVDDWENGPSVATVDYPEIPFEILVALALDGDKDAADYLDAHVPDEKSWAFRTQVKTEQEPMKSLARVEAMRVGGARLSGPDSRVEQPDSIARKAIFVTQVKEWDESEHARGADGRFGDGDAGPKAVSAQAFSNAFRNAMSDNQFKAFVSDHPPDEIESEHMVPLLANSGKTGILVHDHGDGRVEGTALFNNNGPRGAGSNLLQYAIDHHGVNYVECYGPALAATYARLGFKDTAVYPFDRALAAPDWDYEKHGEPEYHIMSLQPETKTMNLQDQFNAHFAQGHWDDPAWLDELHRLSDQLWQQTQPSTWKAMTPEQRQNTWLEALSRM